MNKRLPILLIFAWTIPAFTAEKSKAQPSSLDVYIEEAMHRNGAAEPATPGSVWNSASPMADMARDVRARFVDDLVTIVVVERASALARGDLKSSRQSSLNASINSLAGPKAVNGALGKLADLQTASSIDGGASTSRETVVSTTLAARVTHVLPNGYLVVEGTKEIQLNSERQIVTIRGMARPADLSTQNLIRSDRLAQLEVRVNGKGVVGDAIRRPFFLYRLLLSILPL